MFLLNADASETDIGKKNLVFDKKYNMCQYHIIPKGCLTKRQDVLQQRTPFLLP